MTHPGERVQVDVKVVPRCCIADPSRLFQYTAIDEFTRLRLAAYPEQSTYSSADLSRLRAWVPAEAYKECVQTDNGFEFTKSFF